MDELAPGFNHYKNIKIGHGRIVYAEAETRGRPAGWVLPGGERTSDYAEACRMAHLIDQITRDAQQKQQANQPR